MGVVAVGVQEDRHLERAGSCCARKHPVGGLILAEEVEEKLPGGYDRCDGCGVAC